MPNLFLYSVVWTCEMEFIEYHMIYTEHDLGVELLLLMWLSINCIDHDHHISERWHADKHACSCAYMKMCTRRGISSSCSQIRFPQGSWSSMFRPQFFTYGLYTKTQTALRLPPNSALSEQLPLIGPLRCGSLYPQLLWNTFRVHPRGADQ